jgi:hypothetical protein
MSLTAGFGEGFVPDGTSPPIPVTPGGQPTPQPDVWTFAAGPWTGFPTTELSTATSRSVTWRLTGNHEASLTIDGLSPQATQIAELSWDLWVMWNGQTMFRGRFGASSDTGSENGLSTQFGAADYREILQRRLLFEGDTLSYTATDQSAIAWALIGSTQSKAGGNLHIIRGAGQTTGVIRDRTAYEAGASVGTCLDQLSQVIDGFDYDLNPSSTSLNLSFDLYYPSRGVDRSVVLDYGGRVVSFTRQVDPSTFGNAVRASGDTTLAAIRQEAAGLSTDPAGRWDLQWSDTSITVASTLTGKASKALADGQYIAPSWTVTLAPGGWGGPSDFWLGDQVTLRVATGRLDVAESLRVMEMALAIDDNGSDVMTVTLGQPDPKLKRTARMISRRLSALERR